MLEHHHTLCLPCFGPYPGPGLLHCSQVGCPNMACPRFTALLPNLCPRRCSTCSRSSSCRHVQLAVGAERPPATLQQHLFDERLDRYLSDDRRVRRVESISAAGPSIPELTPGGEMSSPAHAAVMQARCDSPLPDVLQPVGSPCRCGQACWVQELASPAPSHGGARLYDITRCAEAQVFNYRRVCCGSACQWEWNLLLAALSPGSAMLPHQPARPLPPPPSLVCAYTQPSHPCTHEHGIYTRMHSLPRRFCLPPVAMLPH